MSRRLSVFAAVLGVATAIVVGLILVSSGGDDATTRPHKASSRDVTRILRGIPQEGLTLGDPKAPVLLVEFADLQCPFCREFAAESWPDIVQKYIRTGKVKMELRLTNILGEDSVKANKAVMAAALQNRMWDASMRFYDVQGQEQSGYVNDRFLRGVLGGVHGLDATRAMHDRRLPKVQDELAAVHSMMSRYNVRATPTLMIGTDTNDLTKLSDGVVSADALAQAINTQLLKTI